MPTFSPPALERIRGYLAEQVRRDVLPAVSAAIGTVDEAHSWSLGRQKLAALDPLRDDALFLIASPTKPITAMAVMTLVESGELSLVAPAAEYLPEFGKNGKHAITVAHLLTHTSGLPDMPPSNAQLRAAQAPLPAFLAEVCSLRPAFLPGHDVLYQSMGYLVLSAIVEKVTGRSLARVLEERVFAPLALRDTTLGRAAQLDRVAEIRVAGMHSASDLLWNSPYWLGLGAPWGGVVSSAADLARLCQHLLAIPAGRRGVISRASHAAMTANQFAQMPFVPETHRRCQPWGLGWQLHWPAHASGFGDLLSADAYGHWGATGSLVWIDPARGLFAVILSTEPLERSRRSLAQFSNLVCAAID